LLELAQIPFHRRPRRFQELGNERHRIFGLLLQRAQLCLQSIEMFSPRRHAVPRARFEVRVPREGGIEIDEAADARGVARADRAQLETGYGVPDDDGSLEIELPDHGHHIIGEPIAGVACSGTLDAP
jgi:hypothetical protein